MKRKIVRRMQIAALTCLLLGTFLLVSACTGSSGPGSQPSGTPSNGGYSVIYQALQETHLLHMLWQP
ncbi:MAG TPA: hypothetical protein VGF67_19250 [Ktedonobacteraceae bacterium]|jgi:hypothetical protein